MPVRRRALAFTLCLVAPLLIATAVVDKEALIASPGGRYYGILQPDGEIDIVRRDPAAPPIRSRVGEARPSMERLRLGATAEELSRATGLMPGIRPERGDAVVGSTRLRDPLDRLEIFDDGSGFVARYAGTPSRYDDLEPIREVGGYDVALVQVVRKAMGEDARLASFVHLYTLRDAVFWGDPDRRLLVLVAGGASLEVTPDEGAKLAGRADGRRPQLLAWSYATEELAEGSVESLFGQVRSDSATQGVMALLLARELDAAALLPTLRAVVVDAHVPHATRLHAAVTLSAHGIASGEPTITRTAFGVDGAGAEGSTLATAPEGTVDPMRAFALRALPASHGERAIAPLLRLAGSLEPGVAPLAERALADGAFLADSRWLELLAHVARDRGRSGAQRAVATRLLVSRGDARTGELLTWLGADPDPAVSGAVLDRLASRAGDAVLVPKLAAVLKSTRTKEADLRVAIWALADRAGRSDAARSALLAALPSPPAPSPPGSAPAPPAATLPIAVPLVLGALWRLPGPELPELLLAWANSGIPESADAALHSLLIQARAAPNPAAFIPLLDRCTSRGRRRDANVAAVLRSLRPARPAAWRP